MLVRVDGLRQKTDRSRAADKQLWAVSFRFRDWVEGCRF